jgi:lactate dehydrogenase-like 2-hydroxyacid dehydrogenase
MTQSDRDIVLTDVSWPTLNERLARDYRVIPISDLDEAGQWRGARVIVTNGVKPLDRQLLDAMANLGLLAVPAAGYSAVDLVYAAERNIAVTRCAGINHGDVADVAIGLMIALVRGLVRGDAVVRAGAWRMGALRPTRSLGAIKAGIVGLGGIGGAIAERLAPFGCEIAWYGPRPKLRVKYLRHESLLSLAHWADVLFVTLAPNPNASAPIDAEIIAALGPSGVLVNVSRGFAVDEAALIDALRTGALGGAGLDVFLQEPTPTERWEGVPNAVLTPHIGGVTRESLDKVLALMSENLRRFYAGEPLLGRVDEDAV